ncbi:hypothetical protein [Acidianus brierleyi]|uniref:Uncharacterized protein n=1 Tax=Acidianus brierleyi TaxID=41673 RepID=A0A2U9IHV2_9CREN|nr:hypothetical protein [Acidianus brierleyi]AWR95514.1 hypothetical protein DFR85_13860 [Acidianus brierleyi]
METSFYRQALIRNFISIILQSQDYKEEIKKQFSIDQNKERVCSSLEDLREMIEETSTYILGKEINDDEKEKIFSLIKDECI